MRIFDRGELGQNRRQGTESLLLETSTDRTVVEWSACVVLVTTFAITNGFLGGIAGVVTVAVWLSLGTPYALATGVLFLLALTPGGTGPFSVLSVGLGFVALLLAPMGEATEPKTYASSALSTTVVFGGLAWLLLQSHPIWIVATVLLGALAIVAYGLYRYQRLQLGLLGEDEPLGRNGQSPNIKSDHT